MSIKFEFSNKIKRYAARANCGICPCGQELIENYDHIIPRKHYQIAARFGVDMRHNENCGPLGTRCHYEKNKQEIRLNWYDLTAVKKFVEYWQNIHFQPNGTRRTRNPSNRIERANFHKQAVLRAAAKIARANDDESKGYELMKERAALRRKIPRRKIAARTL